ncbi:class I SAM-dependent methyltransferase [Trichlorobacter lovleyi]|uniref:class I SAM-dependent methyltransferase n=1 Tax=Trichlorobacter lovleyi TaxID=313985 RepID=UPI0024803C8A|nr:class I SAM-dependent methyltransferase [Trichlorobacter lovleyi]
MSTEQIYSSISNVVSRRRYTEKQGQYRDATLIHLDVGAGQGQLITRLKECFSIKSHACDYHADRFNVHDVEMLDVNLNKDPLPYPDNFFDVVTCSEVVEHLNDYRKLLSEIYRVTKKNGLVVITTPNVINLKSRIKNLWSGFPDLFGPLPVKRNEFYSCDGHISQVPFFYLAQALYEQDFDDVELDTDKIQKSSVVLFFMLLPFLYIGWKKFLSRETYRYKTIDSKNSGIVLKNFSKEVLLGRTIVVSAKKR